ncbi:MAG: type II secretion system protein GspD [Sedimentisphaerales bacterium]|nr:type II secretion system protein GspD [Sedimentisphaerales bacterium]
MNKTVKKLMTCLIVFLTAYFCVSTAVTFAKDVEGRADSGQGEQDDTAAGDVGRTDPFGGGFGEIQQVRQPDIVVSDQTVISKPPLFVRTVTLKFLSASNLKSALDKMSTEYGSISVNSNTNSLIICDTKDNLERIIAEIKNADKTPKQIMIEVVIVDVQLKDDTEIGVDWDFLSTENKDVFYRQGMIFPDRLSAVSTDTALAGDGTAFMTLGLGGELSIVKDEIRNVVHLLQEKRNVDILASPRVMVVSGQQAEIKTVQEIPYQEKTDTSEGGQLTSTQFKEIGVTLQVKATITDEEKILLDIRPEQNVRTGTSVGGVPVVDTRKASTTLLMDDGQVVVMGGLRRQEISHVKYQVPLLGDLPLIGFIFSDDRTIVENSELLVLLSPHIYKGEPAPAEAMARYKQITKTSLITMPDEPKPKKSSGK